MRETFKTSARVILELGRDAVESKIIALSELVKNAYDADAATCRLRLEDGGDADESKDVRIRAIEITDDGVGMTKEDILEKWLVVGTNSKKDQKECGRRTALGRVPVGEKGIGRFAVGKLGDELTLITKSDGNPSYEVSVDFRSFESDAALQDIDFEIKEVINNKLEAMGHGTILRIESLRESWGLADVSLVYDELLKMQSPFMDKNDTFKVDFDLPDSLNLLEGRLTSEDIIKKCLWSADVVIDPCLNESVMSVNFTPYIEMKGMQPNRYDVVVKHEYRESRAPQAIALHKYNIGKFSVRLYAFHRSPAVCRMLGTQNKEIRNYLDENGGIRVYRGGQRVYNYGSRDEDWLGLNLKRLNSPGKWLSKNVLLGIIDLDPMGSSDLVEKTNREGFTENEAFGQFRMMMSTVIREFAMAICETKSKIVQTYDKNMKSEVVDVSFVELADTIENAEFVDRKAKENILRMLNKMDNDYQQSRDLYLSIAHSSADFHMMFHDIDKQIRSLRDSLESGEGVDINYIREAVRSVGDILEMQKELFTKRDFRVVSVNSLMAKFDMYAKYRKKDHDITIDANCEDFSYRCIESQILRVLINLFDNSVYWMKNMATERLVYIKIVEHNGKMVIYFADSGPGFGVNDASILFKPFVTKKENGLGLGLYIVSEIAERHNGNVMVLDASDKNIPADYSGARLRVELNTKDIKVEYYEK